MNPIETELARIAAHAKGNVGLAALHIESGATLSLNAETAFPMASTVKVPIALAVLDRVATGGLLLTDMIRVESLEMNPSGPIGDEFLHHGAILSVLNLLEPMITRSDNTATDVMYRLAGGPKGVQAWLNKIGLTGIRVDRTVRDLLAVLYGFTPPAGQSMRDALRAMDADEVATRRANASAPNPLYSDDPRDQTTPAAMLELLRRLALAEGNIPTRSRDTLLPIMRRTTTGLRRIEGRLPRGVPVANKTGSAAGTTNDVGLVTLPNGSTLAIAVYVKESPLPPAGREDIIADLARSAYDFAVMQG